MTRVLRYFHQDPTKTVSQPSTSTTTTIVNLDSKQDKIKGKSLSTNDFTDIYKQKLKDIEDKAEVNVQADWNTTDTEDDSYIKNKPSSLPASDVYDWAKQETKPSYNLDEVLDGSQRKLSDYIPVSQKGVYGGVATLGANDGKVPESQLPSYVDDVLEFSDSSYFPQTGESGKIYVDIQTNLTYRWTGTQYTEISPSIALGETSSTAYAGDKGAALKTAFENHAADTTIHITAAERAAWNAKQDAISDLETIRSNASTAYGWGDHSQAGYLTSVDIADMATKTWVGLQGYTTNTGTVTSVAMTVPTGLSVSGSPITTNGTLAITFASGYSIPTTTKQSNWDTAYGWGDHSQAGYQMAISDLATIRSRSDEGHTAYGWGDHSQQGYVKSSGVTSVAMTVPTGLSISGSPITSTGTLALSFANGYSIPTDAKQSNWDTAYSWGNHANEGYLKSITSQMVTNALGYTPPTQDTNTWRPITDTYTGSDTGTSVSQKGTNDLYNALVNGYASSAGNADTVDGEHSNAFLHLIGGTMTGNVIFSEDNKIEWNRNTDGAGIRFKNTDNADSDSYMSFYTLDDYNEYFKFSHFGYNGNEQEWFTIKSDGARVLGNTVWHAGNDGSGSGLDADMLDTKHASDFMARVIHSSMTGGIPTNLEDGIHCIHRPNVEYSSILAMHDYHGSYFQLYVHPTDGYDESIQFRSNNTGGVFRTIIDSNNIGSQSVNYATSAGNADTVDNLHATDFVMAYGTTDNNIDSDWGQSIKTFDPIPSGTPPEQCANISLLSLGNDFARRKQLAFMYDNDNIYYRRNNGLTFSPWVKLLHTGNYAGYALPLTGGTLTGHLNLAGSDLRLGTPNSSSDDSGDIVFYYGNGAEKSRIWTSGIYTNGIGPWYRVYGFDGTLLYNGRLATVGDLENYLPLGGGTLTGNLYIGNSTFYANGTDGGVNSLALANDAILGDCNIGGHLGLKSLNTGNAGISFYASDGTALGRFTASSSGVPLWSDYTIWHSGNDGSGSGLDADTVDGYHENSFLRFRGGTSTNGEGSLWSQIGIKEYYNVLPDGLSGVYSYGSVISIPGPNTRFDIYASHIGSDLSSDYNSSGIYVRTGWNDDRKRWRRLAYADEIAATSGIRDYTQGTLIRTHINYNVTNGDAFYMEITGECYACGFVKTLVRGYIYNDIIINYGVENLGTLQITELYAMNLDGTLCFWFPRLGYWHSFDVKVYKSSTGNYYYNYVAGVLDSAKPTGTKEVLLTNDTYNIAFTTSNVASATQLQTTRYFWGHAFNGTADVTGTINLADSIEFTGVPGNAGHGGYIDFHYNGSSADYTSRIIEDQQGRISVNNNKFYNNAIVTERVQTGLFGPTVVGSPNDAWSDGTWSHPWYSYDVSHDLTSTQTSNIYSYLNEASYHTTISDYFGIALRTNWGRIRLRFDGTLFIENAQYTNKFEFYNNNVESVLAFIDRSGGTYFGLRYGNGSTTSGDYLTVGDQDRNTYLRGRDIYIYPDTGGVVGFFSGNEGYNGVGTSSPSYKLHVNGACAASSFPNTSDIRLKDIYNEWYPSIEDIANAPIFAFKWKNNEYDVDTHIGSSAQYWQQIAPELVTTAKDSLGTLSLQYDILGLASSVTVAKEVTKLQEELEETKEELKLLRAQIAEIKQLLK